MREFDSSEEAIDWIVDYVDDLYVDNERFSYLDDEDGMVKYKAQQEDGCCGAEDIEIKVNGRLATVGCNFGH